MDTRYVRVGLYLYLLVVAVEVSPPSNDGQVGGDVAMNLCQNQNEQLSAIPLHKANQSLRSHLLTTPTTSVHTSCISVSPMLRCRTRPVQ